MEKHKFISSVESKCQTKILLFNLLSCYYTPQTGKMEYPPCNPDNDQLPDTLEGFGCKFKGA